MTDRPRVLFFAFDGVGLLDLTGPLTVFWTATHCSPKDAYDRYTVSLDGGPIVTGEGVTLETVSIAEFAEGQIDTVIVPGALDIDPVVADGRIGRWLRENKDRCRRIASVCAGAFILADAGLLDGRKAVTHWAFCARLGTNYPSLLVDQDAIFVNDGPIWTSAGVSAGIDLALALVQADLGRDIAMQVARQLVIYLKRPGGQSQFSELLQSQEQDCGTFDQLHRWLEKHLADEDLSVERLSDQVGMSARNFARAYKAKTGRTPAKAVEMFRLESARRMLENSRHQIERVAYLCGFGDEDRMRQTFYRHLAVSPKDYRRRFSAGPEVSATPGRSRTILTAG